MRVIFEYDGVHCDAEAKNLMPVERKQVALAARQLLADLGEPAEAAKSRVTVIRRDGWVVLYRDGCKVYEGHRMSEGLTAHTLGHDAETHEIHEPWKSREEVPDSLTEYWSMVREEEINELKRRRDALLVDVAVAEAAIRAKRDGATNLDEMKAKLAAGLGAVIQRFGLDPEKPVNQLVGETDTGDETPPAEEDRWRGHDFTDYDGAGWVVCSHCATRRAGWKKLGRPTCPGKK